MVKYVSANDLNELIETSKLPIVCDFWASWCGPCRMLAPVFEEISDKMEGKAIFVKMDIDEEENETTAVNLGITSIPNIIIFKNGNKVANHVGYVPEETLTKFIEENL